MKPWNFIASGAGVMVYLAVGGEYDYLGWWASAVMTLMFAWGAWHSHQQHQNIMMLLQIMQDREILNDEKVGCIADMAGVGPSWRAQWAIATARVQAKSEKGAKHD